MRRVEFSDMTCFVEEVIEKSKILEGLDLVPLTEYMGRDIAALCNIKTPMVEANYQAYRLKGSDKVDKIVYSELHYMKRAKYCSMNMTAGDAYDLPIFACEFDETSKRASITVDLMPLVDLAVYPEYRSRYLDSLGAMWRKFQKISGLTENGRCMVQRRYGPWPWARASLSPYCLDGRIFEKEDRSGIIEAVIGYARVWLELMEAAEPMPEGNYKDDVITRRRTMQTYYRELDPGGEVLKKLVGDELAKLIVCLIF